MDKTDELNSRVVLFFCSSSTSVDAIKLDNMHKLLVGVFVVVGVASAAVLKPQVVLEDRWSILKCTNGNLTGALEFIDLFRNVVEECGSVRTTSKLFTCVVENLGVTEKDGTPNMEKINDFYTVVFSELILNDLPTLRQELDQCATEFVGNYNLIDGGIVDSAEIFFQCFTSSLGRYGDAFEEVCRYEEALNPGYSATRL